MNFRVFRVAMAGLVAGLSFSALAASDYSTMPGASLMFRINVKALQESPLYKDLTAGQPGGGEIEKKVLDSLGLNKEDILGVSAAASLENLDMANMENPDKVVQSLPFVMQVHLNKAVTQEKILNGLKAANEAAPSPREIVQEGNLIHVKGGDANPSLLCAVVPDGKSVFVSFREVDVQQALNRATSGKAGGVSPDLASILDSRAHFNLAVVLPQSVRDMIKAQLGGDPAAAGQDPDAAMQAMMFKPFAGLKSVSVGARFNAQDADFGLAVDLSTPENATAANTTVAMLSMVLASQMGPAGQKMKFTPEGSQLKLKMNLTKDELLSLAKDAVSAAAGGAGGSDAPEMEEEGAGLENIFESSVEEP